MKKNTQIKLRNDLKIVGNYFNSVILKINLHPLNVSSCWTISLTLQVFEMNHCLYDWHTDNIDASSKAQVLLQKGRAWNILPSFSPEALDALSRAVKLDPQMVEAWNNLGETYWKKNDVNAAKNCFEGALNYVRNIT